MKNKDVEILEDIEWMVFDETSGEEIARFSIEWIAEIASVCLNKFWDMDTHVSGWPIFHVWFNKGKRMYHARFDDKSNAEGYVQCVINKNCKKCESRINCSLKTK